MGEVVGMKGGACPSWEGQCRGWEVVAVAGGGRCGGRRPSWWEVAAIIRVTWHRRGWGSIVVGGGSHR
jgi:hypothetical protein